jgi:peroxiredoxin
LDGFAKVYDELKSIGASVLAASVDVGEKAQEVANGLPFAVAQGVSREVADGIGAWWEEKRNFIQPSEFVVGADGRIVTSSYSSGPLGRIDGADVVKLVKFYESRKS